MTHILKFGGTSVSSPEALENVIRIIRERAQRHRILVVVSALAGVTSALDAAASIGDASIVESLRERHVALLRELTSNDWNGSGPAVARLLHFLRLSLHERASRGTPQHDAIVGMGERLAAPLVAEVLRHRGICANAIDATEIVLTDDTHGNARVDLDATRRRLLQRLARIDNGAIPVITGYVGATPDGIPTTLGRGGSDITAAILGAALDVDEVEIWSDVDGLFSADPRTVSDARLLPRLSHDAALQLAREGAKVLHPDAIPPLAERGIRIAIRNTFAPDRRGTEIGTRTPVELVIAGATGNVGSALVRQLRDLQPRGVRLRILANSRFTNDSRACGSSATDWEATLRTVEAGSLFIDCTASADVAGLYETLLESGIGVVTANKIAGSGDADRWSRLRRIADHRALPLRYETTAGAALPILRTARELTATGDSLIALDAVLSGTISYILERIHDGIDFSAAVAEARAKGFTEPDPLIDLSGRDVAAKLVILLRELGITLESTNVRVEPLASTADEVLSEDSLWHARADRAATHDRRLVFVASYVDGVATARIREIDRDDPLARLRAGENIVILRTRRYDTVPLTIAGPGAGPEVTAAGILAEILDAARERPSP